MIKQGYNPEDYVFCFICENIITEGNNTVNLKFMIVPLANFEANSEEKLPFRDYSLLKKCGVWMSSDLGSFFHLINKRIGINKDNKLFLMSVPRSGKKSLAGFVGSCLSEHMKNEKISKKELALNLEMTVRKLNRILKGSPEDLDIHNTILISFEIRGKNKVRNYSVMVEKIKKVEKKYAEDEIDFLNL